MKDELEKYIAKNRDRFDDKTPPPLVLDRILAEMQPEKKEKPEGVLISFRAIWWAAASLILIAGAAAFFTLRTRPDADIVIVKTKPPVQQSEPIAKAEVIAKPVEKKLDSVDNDLDLRKQRLIAKIKTRNAGTQKTVSFASLHDAGSPASRIAATLATEKLGRRDNSVIDALVQTLNNDPNSNVRLAALDGLARFYQETYVRKQLTDALKKQHDPVVQIAMINMLIRMRASGILEELNDLVNDANTQKVVKDCAYSGINQLRSI